MQNHEKSLKRKKIIVFIFNNLKASPDFLIYLHFDYTFVQNHKQSLKTEKNIVFNIYNLKVSINLLFYLHFDNRYLQNYVLSLKTEKIVQNKFLFKIPEAFFHNTNLTY